MERIRNTKGTNRKIEISSEKEGNQLSMTQKTVNIDMFLLFITKYIIKIMKQRLRI